MRIVQINPGIFGIPPNGHGATEKVISEYLTGFNELGHEASWNYLDNIWGKTEEIDILHIHVWNLALMAHERGWPYIFSLHDHNVVRCGKNSDAYRLYLEAINKSVISITHAEFILDWYKDDTDKLIYLPHGVNTKFFSKPEPYRKEQKLLCVAANGYPNHTDYDRKGFRYAIEASSQLGMPLTIVGPECNRVFFEGNPDLMQHENVTIISSNPSEEELLGIYREHSIFIHASDMEAGHPNLTILEAISCGLPVVGTYQGSKKIDGLVKAERTVESVTNGIMEVTNNYKKYVDMTQVTKNHFDWMQICRQLESIYKTVMICNKRN